MNVPREPTAGPERTNTPGRPANRLAQTAFAAGVLLVGLNLIGVIVPLRHPDLADQVETEVRSMPLLSESEFYVCIERHGETDAEYAVKLTQAVHEGLLHVRPIPGDLKYHWNIPIYENYLLWLSRQALFVCRWIQNRLGHDPRSPQETLIYEFSGARKAIERGVGLCSQHTVVLMEFLQGANIPARYLGLKTPGIGGHAVVEAEVDQLEKTRWILDADYGVIVPVGIAAIRLDPTLPRRYYEEAGYDRETVDLVMSQYRHSENFRILEDIKEGHGVARYYFEFASYYLIWVIPVFLMLPLAWRMVCRFRAR